MSNLETPQYPLLEQILSILNRSLQATYSTRDVASIFQVSPRAIQHRIASGQLMRRDLPGRARFLPQDIEDFLAGSRRGPQGSQRSEFLEHRILTR
jgi:hypothetical protein